MTRPRDQAIDAEAFCDLTDAGLELVMRMRQVSLVVLCMSPRVTLASPAFKMVRRWCSPGGAR